jgi:hypothetical protein
MANLISVAQTVSNAGATVAALGDNFLKHVISQSDAGRELIVKISANAGILNSELSAAINEITRSQGTGGAGDSAFTVAALGTAAGAAFVAGTTQVVFLRCQGTGDLTLTDIKAAAEAADANGTTFTVTTEAIFAPAN